MNSTTTEKTVAKATSYLRSLAKKRTSSIVTADDVQSFLSKAGFKGNTNKRLSVIRSVLRGPTFYAIGNTRSTREAARSRTITAWKLNS